MIPWRFSFRPGVSLYEQVVYAAKKAIISGQLRPGDPFPSVRALSTELKINPNTAHKVITHLVTEGLLEVRPGIGTVVALPPQASASARRELLGNEIEQFVVEAKRLGMGRDDVLNAVSEHWKRLGNAIEDATTQTNHRGRKQDEQRNPNSEAVEGISPRRRFDRHGRRGA